MLKKIAGWTLILVALLALYLVWLSSRPFVTAEPFDAESWRKGNTLNPAFEFDPGCYRGGMALDLIERELLLGKSRHEVAHLLGKPKTQTDAAFWYEVGQCSMISSEFSQIAIEFGPNKTVKEVRFEFERGR